MHKLMSGVMWGVACLVVFAQAGGGAIITLNTNADGAVSDGGGSPVAITNGQTITQTQFAGGFRSVGIYEFDLSSISDTDTINSAVFSFTLTGQGVNGVTNPTVPFIVEAYLGDGVVNVADFTTMGTQVVSSSMPHGTPAGSTQSFMLSTLVPVQSALAGNLLTLRLSTPQLASQIQIAAIEDFNLSEATLTLDATAAGPMSGVPEPSSWAMLLGGFGALGIFARRRA